MSKILVVEDEQHMLMGIKDNLEFEGYEVDFASDGETALEKGLTISYDLILLDVMLPKISGFDICKRIRKEGVETPVIFLTAKSEEIDKVIGLETGGDDYVTKPFSLRELLARIKAVLRRSQVKSDVNREIKTHTIGRLTVDFDAYNATSDGKAVKLSIKEYEILHYLWRRKNTTVKRDAILDDVWGDDYQPTARTIDNFIVKLRQKIEEDHNNPQVILTIHGIGYRLIPD